jgi:ABC-type transport system involved in multi-copper enzyme maturation permease subunit
MLGPVFRREFAVAPRRERTYVGRFAFVAGLLALAAAAYQLMFNAEPVRNLGDLARFNAGLFPILSFLQLVVVVFFAALSSASAVSLEKDRRTLELLLLTNLSDVELVLGKLAASLLQMTMLLLAAVPYFFLSLWLGGVSDLQVLRVFAVTLASVLFAGSLGSTIAFWRERTFQTLALTTVMIVLLSALGELLAQGWIARLPGLAFLDADAAALVSPWRALFVAVRPLDVAPPDLFDRTGLFVLVAFTGAVALNLLAILMLRVWNPSREMIRASKEGDEDAVATTIWGRPIDDPASSSAPSVPAPSVPAPSVKRGGGAGRPGRSRPVWTNPILWREVRTQAYGRKMIVVRLAYLVVFALAAASVWSLVSGDRLPSRWDLTPALAGVAVLSWILVNAQAVTSITSERDLRALDVLLCTDLTPREFILGKLGGAFWNTKEMILGPVALIALLAWRDLIDLQQTVSILLGFSVLTLYVATLGLHSGLTYANSRSAVLVSLGTVFFLTVGVAVCMRIITAFSGNFEFQLVPFIAVVFGGAVGLYAALGVRNPSQAIGWAAAALPFLTFYAIISFLREETFPVLAAVSVAYGFGAAALLVPAISEFDVATGRSEGQEG